MLHICLFQPEIPPNTGNIIRLCANTGAQLHLIHPLGFSLAEKPLRRAGLDYHEWAQVKEYDDYQQFKHAMAKRRIFACTTKASQYHSSVEYKDEDILLFGPETRGLPADILTECKDTMIRIPMLTTSRSLNLSNAVAIITYEALRQLGYEKLS